MHRCADEGAAGGSPDPALEPGEQGASQYGGQCLLATRGWPGRAMAQSHGCQVTTWPLPPELSGRG